MPVGQAFDAYRTEDRGQRPRVAGFDVGVAGLLRVGHLGQAALAPRPQVQVVLVELAQQLASPGVELVLELRVGQPGRVTAIQEAEHHLEPFPARGEAILIGMRVHPDLLQVAPHPRAISYSVYAVRRRVGDGPRHGGQQ